MKPNPLAIACLAAFSAAALSGLYAQGQLAQPVAPPYAAPMQAGIATQPETENVLIILDASKSMAESMGEGHSKMAMAKRTLLDLLQKIPPNVNVALRVYGTSASMNEYSACRATQLLVPFGSQNRNLIASKLVGLKPTGLTPISHTLITAIEEDFPTVTGKKSIILVSDGMETCAADPCDVAVRMVRRNVDVKINVVGLGLHDFDSQKQLKCVALATKGKYYSADTAAQLASTMGHLLGAETKVQAQILTPTTPSVPPAAKAQPAQPKPIKEIELDAGPIRGKKVK